MATRVYFPQAAAAPVTPPAPSADWEHNNGLTRSLLLAPDGSAILGDAYTPDAADHLVNGDACHRQYVSGPLKAQTISGNVKAQFQAGEANAGNNLFLTIKILVCSNDGSTTRATILAITRDTTLECGTAVANRSFRSVALSSYTCVDGDRIVVEVGLGGTPTGAGGVQGHNGTIRWAGAASSGDLPENDTETAITYRPWLEFANTIKWLAEADGSSAGVAASSVAGAAVWASGGTADGVGASSVAGAAVWGSAGSADGVAGSSVTSATVFAGEGTSAGSATVSGVGEDGAGAGSTGTSAGVAAAVAQAAAVWAVGGSADGLASAGAVGAALSAATGSVAGSGSTNGAGAGVTTADGSASGQGVTAGSSAAVFAAVGTAAGAGTATGEGANGAAGGIVEATGTAAGVATVLGEAAQGEGRRIDVTVRPRLLITITIP